MRRMPNRPLPLAAAALLATAAAAWAAETAELPVEAGGKDTIEGAIEPVGDADTFALALGEGDVLNVKVADAPPSRGLSSTLALFDADGVAVAIDVRNQGGARPSFKWQADATGRYVLRITGDPGGFGGAAGNYSVRFSVKRSKIRAETYDDPAGGAFAYRFPATVGAEVVLTAKAKKAGTFTVDELRRPDGTPDPNFAPALLTKGKKATAKLVVTGGTGAYELRGTYDAAAKLKVSAKVGTRDRARKRRLSSLEPRIDPFLLPFPDRGIAGTLIRVFGQNFTFEPRDDGQDVFPTLRLGGIEIPREEVERPNGATYAFPVPAGLAVGAWHDLELVNADGQGAVVLDAFQLLPPPEPLSIFPAEDGTAGGRAVRIGGRSFRPGSVVLFDDRVVVPDRILSTSIDLTTPAHAAGAVTVRVRDDYGQIATVPQPFTYYDVFEDVSATAVPDPVAGAGTADGWRATRVLHGDLDSDDDPDLVLIRPEMAFGDDVDRPRVRVLENQGGTFVDRTATAVPAVSGDEDWRARDAVLADLDGDGDLDLALITDDDVEGGARSSLRILVNDGTGDFTDATASAAPSATDWGDRNQGVALVAADVDGVDGVDLVLLHTAYFTHTVVTPAPEPDPDEPPPDPPPSDTIENFYYAGLRVLLNDGAGAFARAPSKVPAVLPTQDHQYQGDALAVGDVDGDSDADLVLTRETPTHANGDPGTLLRTAVLLRNDGSGTFSDASADLPAAADPDHLQGDRVWLADVDGDLDLDVVLTANLPLVTQGGVASTAPATRLLLNSSGVFAAAPAGMLPGADRADVSQAEGVAVGDVNGDGLPDLALVSSRAPNTAERGLRLLVRVGAGFERQNARLPDPLALDDMRGSDVVLLDVDGDGDLDLVVGRDESDETARNTRILLDVRLP